MTHLRIIRYGALLVAALLLVGLATLYFMPRKAIITEVPIGGPFELVSHSGRTVTEADLIGHPTAMFFGFTYCPDVCPTTLYELTGWLHELGPAAEDLKVYFVSVDPERDTPEQLSRYLGAFDPRIVGLTGDQEAVDAIIEAYRVYARKVPLDGGGYTMDHTASIYLLDSNGAFVGTISYGEDTETAITKLTRLIEKS